MATRLEPFARKQPGAARQADHVEHRAQHARHKGNHMLCHRYRAVIASRHDSERVGAVVSLFSVGDEVADVCVVVEIGYRLSLRVHSPVPQSLDSRLSV
mgnify:CR=1 FL=1